MIDKKSIISLLFTVYDYLYYIMCVLVRCHSTCFNNYKPLFNSQEKFVTWLPEK